MDRIRTAVIGTGFMGRTHLEALRRVENVDVVEVAATSREKAQHAAAGYNVLNATGDWRDVIADPSIDAVHITTPNDSHFSIAKAAFEAGKHVLCEKPLAMNVAEAEELVALQTAKKLRGAVNHNLRYYPMVQQMRSMREAGEFGEILVVQGTYSQDWMLYQTDWNWRVDPAASGASRVMADIGSHFFDMAEHVTGLRVSTVCSDLATFWPTRKQPLHDSKGAGGESFSGKLGGTGETVDVAVTTEDFGSTIFRMAEKGGVRARGAMTASQVSAGRKNGLVLEIYGTKGGASWRQEAPDELWLGHRNDPNQLLLKDPSLLTGNARGFADYPGGHAEGYPDTHKQLFRRFYASIADPSLTPDYPQMTDGLRQLKILEAELASNKARAWVDV
ncbi:MAG TPA: Gfo/Idh/MocA family oxidoreductase [Rhizomicrobium sp.]|jgi:predicted dehydrogenase|nr:Gfo/Idh/MocA family oxidoreductase [Rhizomicrobium sp.]